MIISYNDDKEKLWRHIFQNELGVTSHGAAVLMTETPLNPKENREKLTTIMFERFNVGRFYLCIDGVLELLASGRGTGVVINSGKEITYTLPVWRGYASPQAAQQMDIGGMHVTDYLQKLLIKREITDIKCNDNCSWAVKAFDTVNTIKETLCYVALDHDKELEKSKTSIELQQDYKLPDGGIIRVDTERFQAPEILFDPKLIGLESDGVHQLLCDTMIKAGDDVGGELDTALILAGGNTMFDGFGDRLSKELKELVGWRWRINVKSPSDRKYGTYIGGTMLASLSTFEEMWITREEYNEHGPGIVHRKCL